METVDNLIDDLGEDFGELIRSTWDYRLTYGVCWKAISQRFPHKDYDEDVPDRGYTISANSEKDGLDGAREALRELKEKVKNANRN